ncbi:hypothetical protein ACIREM_14850 [Streptomyces shenzhenensis]|uniref:DUF7848 domain-containing protein n=1 Tax=Streptomyces shenzhenensis TaxID=943815 RepID=UPI0037F506E8
MTAVVRTAAYPALTSRITLDDLPVRRWVECASCIESQDIEHTTEAEAWAEEHHDAHPGHSRFRIVRQTGWRIDPSAEAICGATTLLPPTFIELEKRVVGVDWTGVVVTCDNEPHAGPDHSGPLMLDGERKGTHHWTAP